MKVLINGILGHMGLEVAKLAREGMRGAVLAAGADVRFSDSLGTADDKDSRTASAAPAVSDIPVVSDIHDGDRNVDVIVDFSHHDSTASLLDFAVANDHPLVIATTGQTESEKEAILAASKKIPIFFAANYSLGVALLIELAKQAAKAMPDAEIEIIEKHHDRKLDAPSGTALAIARAIQTVRSDATIHTGRSGYGKRSFEEIGIHSIRMGNIVGEHEVILGTQSQTITLKHEAHSRALFAEGALAAAEFLQGKPAGLYDMTSLLTDMD